MSNYVTSLHPAFMFRLETPSNVLIKVFTSLHPYQYGYLRLDSNVQRCVDPWTSAMKYMDHLAARGWDGYRVDHFVKETGSVVIITMEKPLV